MVSDWPIGKNQHRLDAAFFLFCFVFIKNMLTSYSVLRFSTTIMNLLIRKNNFVCDFFLLEEDKKKIQL